NTAAAIPMVLSRLLNPSPPVDLTPVGVHMHLDYTLLKYQVSVDQMMESRERAKKARTAFVQGSAGLFGAFIGRGCADDR
ncbi:MAG TPA: hypothetical protein VNT75_20395, partial [Symbiobacteriaceae bacterium]|nr:hypothetical protein [Symbiobacteriaceae bacterium]